MVGVSAARKVSWVSMKEREEAKAACRGGVGEGLSEEAASGRTRWRMRGPLPRRSGRTARGQGAANLKLLPGEQARHGGGTARGLRGSGEEAGDYKLLS